MEWIYKGNCLINKIVFLDPGCGDGHINGTETCDLGQKKHGKYIFRL